METVRIQFTKQELWLIRNLLVLSYHQDRNNVRYEKNRIVRGQPESKGYPIKEQEKHLKTKRRLVKKVARYLDEKWFIR